MSFAKGISNQVIDKRKNISDADIAGYYFGITKVPVRIFSPLRQDKHPSLGIYSRDGEHIYYVDFGTEDRGHITDLLGKMWGTDYNTTWERIVREFSSCSNVKVNTISQKPIIETLSRDHASIQVRVREWRNYDDEYWNSYGITRKWLEYADVHPISHIIFTKEDGKSNHYPADKLAYTFVEFKEGKVTYKVYQPLNTKGFKWFSSHDRSVISLWTKVPEYGQRIVICSSLKDALCLWSNTGIPAIAPQGEGYSMSETAINELKRRYKEIYILYDSDTAGEKDSDKLQKQTNFIKVSLPKLNKAKDISDIYHYYGKEYMLSILKKSPLF